MHIHIHHISSINLRSPPTPWSNPDAAPSAVSRQVPFGVSRIDSLFQRRFLSLLFIYITIWILILFWSISASISERVHVPCHHALNSPSKHRTFLPIWRSATIEIMTPKKCWLHHISSSSSPCLKHRCNLNMCPDLTSGLLKANSTYCSEEVADFNPVWRYSKLILVTDSTYCSEGVADVDPFWR